MFEDNYDDDDGIDIDELLFKISGEYTPARAIILGPAHAPLSKEAQLDAVDERPPSPVPSWHEDDFMSSDDDTVISQAPALDKRNHMANN